MASFFKIRLRKAGIFELFHRKTYSNWYALSSFWLTVLEFLRMGMASSFLLLLLLL